MAITRVSTFAQRLRQGLDEANMKASRLSELTGIPKSSISHYLKGDWEGKQYAVLLIAKALHVSEAWLMGYDVPKPPTLPTSPPPNYILAPSDNNVPLLGKIKNPRRILSKENIKGTLNLPAGIIADFAIQNVGDSMEGARIFDGDYVFIREKGVDNGDVVAILLGEKIILRRLCRNGFNLLFMTANPKYSPIDTALNENTEYNILGKAVCFLSKVR